jgi:hypothetical protein
MSDEVLARDPEILPAARQVEILEPPVHLVTALHPLSSETTAIDLAAGQTIAELLAGVGIPSWAEPRVYVNGDLVYPEFFHVVRPKRGAHVLVRVVPRGGYNKNVGNIVTGILLIINGTVASGFGYWGIGVPLIGAGVGLILTGVNNLIIPAPRREMAHA